jgi:Sec7-like guanine-nucleotide exchange factor
MFPQSLKCRPMHATVRHLSHLAPHTLTIFPCLSSSSSLIKLRLLRAILRASRDTVANTTLQEPLAPAKASLTNRYTHQIKSASNQMILHTRTILTPASAHQHNRMLLHIMSLARNISRNNFPTAQSDPRNFALAGIRFLGLRGSHSQTHAFHFGAVDKRW